MARADKTAAKGGSSGTAPTGAESAFAPEELRAISAEISGIFPPPQETGLVLLDVDPRRLHAYWTVTPAQMAEARENAGIGDERPTLVLRVHDLGEEGRAPFDVEVQGLQSRQYLDLWEDGRSLEAELGILKADGSLAGLARSNRVDLPRLTPSTDTGYREAGAEAPVRTFPDLTPPSRSPAPSPAPLSEEGEESPAFPEIPAETLETYAAQAHETEERFTEAVPDAPRAESLSAPPPGPIQNSEEAPVPLESVVTYSSFEMGRGDLDLEINAELHIFGRARPGKRLTLFGREVPLRPDGTFSVRRPLPDGAMILPLTLTDEDSEDR